MNNTYDSNYSIAIEINLKLGNEPKNFDSTYSICMDIYNKLGGDKTGFDSIYSILESIMQLINAEHTNQFDSIYSQCLSIYNKLGGQPALFDSTYSILLGILPLVEPGPGPEPPTPTDNRLRFEAVENSTFGLSKLASVSTVQYSLDGTNWNDLTTTTNVNLNAGETAYLRGKITGNLTSSDYTQFKMSGKIAAKGNIMYLYDYETLPDTITYTYTFNYLFRQCAALISAPELPATTLANYCYRYMFYQCTGLTTAPELLAPTLVNYCYNYMFSGCSNLNYIKCMATNISASSCTANWVSNVASSGTFLCDASVSWNNGNNGVPNGWNKIAIINFPEPTVQFNPADSLKFTAKEDALFGLTRKNNAYTLYFSKDNENWGQLTTAGVFEVKNDDVIYVCGNLTGDQSYGTNNTNFSITGKTTVEGSINSLWDYATLNDTTYRYACYRMFEGCTGLLNTPSLPATTLTEASYAGMFKDCTSLTTTPLLPATSLYKYDYVAMFKNCTGLTSIQDFPTYITKSDTASSFSSMFEGCSSLTDLSTLRLPLQENNTAHCFGVYNFSSANISSDLGIVTSQSTSFNRSGMFKNCTCLSKAPELPATTLVTNCYDSMFSGCSSLVNAPELPATTLTNYCYNGMFAKCSSLVNAPELPATTLANYCYFGMFAECNSLVNAPELPATTLANYCYQYMFWWSRNVNYIKCLAEDISATYCTQYWVTSVASTGTFVKNANMTSWTTGENGIPSGWTVIDA